MNSTVKLYVNPIWNDLRNLQKNVSALSYDYLHHNHLDIGYIQGIGNSINPNAFTSGNVIFVGDNITVNSSLDGTRQYIHLIGNTGGSGAIGGTSIIPGDYLSSSLNGSTLYISVTGLYPSANTSLITSNAVNTSVLTNLQYTSNTSNITTNAVNTSITSQWLTTAAPVTHTHNYAASVHTHDYQTTGNYLTTAANSTHTHPQYVNTSASSLLQHTSATSAITANALNTSAVSSITVNAMNTSERVNYYYTSNNTFANSTHTHGNISLALSNLTGTTASASNGMTLSISALEGGTLSLINSNNVSFGTSISENITSVTASVGKVHFVNINGFSWTSSTAAGNTSYYLVTA